MKGFEILSYKNIILNAVRDAQVQDVIINT